MSTHTISTDFEGKTRKKLDEFSMTEAAIYSRNREIHMSSETKEKRNKEQRDHNAVKREKKRAEDRGVDGVKVTRKLSSTPNAIKLREFEKNKTPAVKENDKKKRKARYAAKRRQIRAKNLDGRANIHGAELQKLLTEREARVTQGRAAEDPTRLSTARGKYVGRTSHPEEQQHAAPSSTAAPTASGVQSSRQHSDSASPTTNTTASTNIPANQSDLQRCDDTRLAMVPEAHQRTAQMNPIDQQSHQSLHETQQPTAPSIDTTTTTFRNQSGVPRSDGTHQRRTPGVQTPDVQAITRSTMSSESDQHTTQPHLAAQQTCHGFPQSYGNHPVVELETLVKYLSDGDAKIALLLFTLVREDHKHSGDHVEELNSFFAPLRKQLDGDLIVVDEKLLAFKKAEEAVLEYETLVGGLDDAAAEDAKAVFRLVRRNFKDGQRFSSDLYEIFEPLKERYKDERAHVLETRQVFEKIDEATQQCEPSAVKRMDC